jgi:hypothetical protein
MSTGSQFFPPSQSPDLLGELLHSLNQPLTSLRCVLELSIDDVEEQQKKSMLAALQQTEEVIGAVQLLREYLDADQTGTQAASCALAPALVKVAEELSTVAAVRGVWLSLEGSSSAALPMPESRLRLALQYLIASMIEGQQPGGKVLICLEEDAAGTILRAKSDRSLRDWRRRTLHPRKPQNQDKNDVTLRRVRLGRHWTRLFGEFGTRFQRLYSPADRLSEERRSGHNITRSGVLSRSGREYNPAFPEVNREELRSAGFSRQLGGLDLRGTGPGRWAASQADDRDPRRSSD